MVTTWAGVAGRAGHCDGPGRSAAFSRPRSLTVARDGTIFVADAGNNCVRQISPTGEVTTLRGCGVGGSSDSSGSGSGRSGGSAADKVATAEAARRTAALAALKGPAGCCMGENEESVLVCDTEAHCVKRIWLSAGTPVEVVAGSGERGWRDGTAQEARFAHPHGLALSRDGIVLADTCNNVIRLIKPNGDVTTLAGVAEKSGYADGPAATALFASPMGVAVDESNGNILVADTHNKCLRCITPDGFVQTLVCKLTVEAGEEGAAKAAWMPTGVAANAERGIFVCDAVNGTVLSVLWEDKLQNGRAPPQPANVLAGSKLPMHAPFSASASPVFASSLSKSSTSTATITPRAEEPSLQPQKAAPQAECNGSSGGGDATTFRVLLPPAAKAEAMEAPPPPGVRARKRSRTESEEPAGGGGASTALPANTTANSGVTQLTSPPAFQNRQHAAEAGLQALRSLPRQLQGDSAAPAAAVAADTQPSASSEALRRGRSAELEREATFGVDVLSKAAELLLRAEEHHSAAPAAASSAANASHRRRSRTPESGTDDAAHAGGAAGKSAANSKASSSAAASKRPVFRRKTAKSAPPPPPPPQAAAFAGQNGVTVTSGMRFVTVGGGARTNAAAAARDASGAGARQMAGSSGGGGSSSNGGGGGGSGGSGKLAVGSGYEGKCAVMQQGDRYGGGSSSGVGSNSARDGFGNRNTQQGGIGGLAAVPAAAAAEATSDLNASWTPGVSEGWAREVQALGLEKLSFDVVFVVGQLAVEVHHQVLSLRSSFFREQLSRPDTVREYAARGFLQINVGETSPHAFRELMQYMYTGRLHFSRAALVHVAELSRLYVLNEVTAHCEQQLIRLLDPSSAVALLRFAHDSRYAALREAALMYIAGQIREIRASHPATLRLLESTPDLMMELLMRV